MIFQKHFNTVLVVLLMMALLLTACAEQPAPSESNSSEAASAVASKTTEDDAFTEQANVKHTDQTVGFQLEAPAAGEKAAVLHTNYGDIYIRLFPEIAPKTVENFVGLIESGYYNGLIFHRVINNFCVQGGDPNGDGTGGESLWGDKFEDEFCSELLNIKYAVAMANSGPATNGSQFFIDHAADGAFKRDNYSYETLKANHDAAYDQYYSMYDQYVAYYGDSLKSLYPTAEAFADAQAGAICPDARAVPDAVWDLYEAQGGNISLDGAWRESGGHTVFGQVYRGMDVVDAIAAVEVDSSNNRPVKDVVIQSAEIITVS